MRKPSRCNGVENPQSFYSRKGYFGIDVQVIVKGGGKNAQAIAIRHAISRALTKVDPANRGLVKPEGFLTRDPRMKERKKPGQPGARARFQFSKR
jgi:small subunit ribosomal protein S9